MAGKYSIVSDAPISSTSKGASPKYSIISDKSQEQKKQSLMESRSFVSPKGPMETIQNVSQYLQREEAIVANPMLKAMRKMNPAFGREEQTLSVKEAIIAGAKGETLSPFAPERQVELGDVFREMGAPESVAAIGGSVATEALPSSLAMTAAGGFIGRFFVKKGSQMAVKALTPIAAKKIGSSLAHVNDFRNIFRTIEQKTGKGMQQVAEVLESTTNIDSREILYAFNNPQILTKKMAQPEIMGDLVKDFASKTKTAIAKNPDAFMVNDSIPLELAKTISDDFNSVIQTAGKDVGKQKDIVNQVLKAEKELTGMTRGVDPKVIDGISDGFLKSRNFLDEAGNVKPAFKDSPVVMFFNEIKSKINDTTNINPEISKILGPNGMPIVLKKGSIKPLEFQDLMDFKKVIQDVAYKTGVIDGGGVMKPLPDVQAAAQFLNGNVNAIVKQTYQDFPELVKSFEKFSSLADVRADVAKTLGTPEKLAGLLRRVDSKNPEQLTTLYELIGSIPNGKKYLKSVDTFIGMKESSLANRLPITGSPIDVESGLMNLLNKKPGSWTVDEANAIENLAKEVGFNLDDVVAHKVAKSFSQKSNFFRALASGSIITGAVAGGLHSGVPGAFVGAAAGFAATDPRMVGGAIRMASTPFGKGVASVGKGAYATAKGAGVIARESSTPIARRIMQEQDTRQLE